MLESWYLFFNTSVMKIFFSLAMVILLFNACKKEEDTLTPLNYTITYEVKTTSGTWFGEYIDSTGTKRSTGTAMPSGWKYSFKLKSLPFTMHVDATAACLCSGTPTSPDVTINFYSNGVLFKTETNNWAKGVTSLDFVAAVSVP